MFIKQELPLEMPEDKRGDTTSNEIEQEKVIRKSDPPMRKPEYDAEEGDDRRIDNSGGHAEERIKKAA